MPQDSPSRTQDQFLVRMPEGLRERIAKAAKANSRSMNAEIVNTLEEYYPPDNTIEDTIYFAEEVLKDLAEDASYARLRTLRELLSELVDQLKRAKQDNG